MRGPELKPIQIIKHTQMVEFCCRVNVCFHILISGWKRGGGRRRGLLVYFNCKKNNNELSYKDTEDFGGLLAQEQ